MQLRRRNHIAPRSILTLALLSLFASAGAAREGFAWGGPAFSIDPKEALAEAAAVPSAEGDPAVYLIDEESYRFEADGTAVFRRHAIYSLLLERGVERLKSVSCGYQPWRQGRPTINARVIGPSGTVYLLDQSTLADSTSREEKDVYTDARTLTAPLPGVEVGAVVEFEIELRDRSPQLSAGGAYRCGFGYSVPCRSRTLTLDYDSALPLRYATRGPGSDRISVLPSSSGSRKVLRFSAEGLEAIREIEKSIPRSEVPVACVDFSTAESWRAVAESYASVAEPFIADASAEAFARDALVGVPDGDRKATIVAIAGKIGRDIRYTGINFGENAIVPHAPADTIARGYGDCKDQAVLLAASLRTVGVDARLALLCADIDSDVLEGLPGFGLFNHAIVFLPEDGAWIDPTASFFRPGELPPADLGRNALVIAPGARALTRTPEPSERPSDYREIRAFELADAGPASVVETTTATGVIEANYRSGYASSDPKWTREHLEKYVEDVYRSDSLDDYSYSGVRDMENAFTLRIEASKAARCFTNDSSSVAILQSGSLFNFLPQVLTAKPDEKAKKREADVELPYFFRAELEFRLSPPPGFKAAALPESASRRLGPATLDSTYSLSPDGTVVAVFRLDPAKVRYSPSEAEAMRDAILEYYDEDAPRVIFEQVGESLLSAGKYREALDEFRALAERYPRKALHRMQISRTLEAAGFGADAREEARTAVRLEPSSAKAHAHLAWTYIIGPFARTFEEGCDLARAAREYAIAARLDPSNIQYVANQAILAEYGDDRVRYGRGARLDEALALYGKIQKKLKGSDWENNPLYDLMRLGRFKEVRDATKAAPANTRQKALYVCSVAALDGSEAALREATRVAAATDERRETLALAASMLLISRRYPESAALMIAGARGSQSQTQALALADQLRTLKPIEPPRGPGDDPRILMASLARVALESAADPVAIAPFFAESARASLKSPEGIRALASALSAAAANISGEGSPAPVIADIVAGFGSVSTLESGPAIAALHSFPAFPSYRPIVYYLKREEGALRIVDAGSGLSGVAREVLSLLGAGDVESARAWFSLLKDQATRDPRFPSLDEDIAIGVVGDPAAADAARMRSAASLALARSSSVGDGLLALPGLLAAIDSIADREDRATAIRLAANCMSRAGASKEAARLADSLGALVPEDEYANWTRVRYLDAAGEQARAADVVSAVAGSDPSSAAAIRLSAEHDAANGRFAEAVRGYVELIDKGLARDSDYNQAAWYSLFMDSPDYGALEAYRIVQRLMSGSAAEMHTLACVLADGGRILEAQEAFRKYLSLDGSDPRSPSTWLAFGLHAESFGLRDTAVDAYRRAGTERSTGSGVSSGDLALLHLRRLGEL